MKIVFLFLGIFALLYLILVYLAAPTSRKHPDLEKIKGKYVAHRGLHDENLPENSIAAFKAAVEQGYPIEIDLHLTCDGEVVVFHDKTLNRMCGCDGEVAKLTLDDLKSKRLKDSQETIPTLRECLEAVNGKVPLLIEYKMENGNTGALCKTADEILSKYQGSYLIQSFFPQVLAWYKKNRKNVCRGQLASHFRKQGFAKWLSGNLLLNFLGRPDFVSYKHSDKSNPMLKFVIWLGASPVGWTYRTKKELKTNGEAFKTWIFESLTPDK